jgi:prephenate dehydrogenase
MDGDLHDRIFASVSHLPHLLAYATIQAIADSDSPEALEHSGAGLKGFSRIASSSPEMWADIFLQNQQPLLQRVDAFSSCISEIREAIVTNDRERLIELLAQAKAAKDRWVH